MIVSGHEGARSLPSNLEKTSDAADGVTFAEREFFLANDPSPSAVDCAMVMVVVMVARKMLQRALGF